MTELKVGSRSLATYTYGESNGLLLSQSYANGDIVSFTYDHLGRAKTVTYPDGTVVTYTYNGEGSLYSVTAEKDGAETRYIYGYNSLGRLISSEWKDNGASVLRTRQGYDDTNRLVTQSWQLGSDVYTEGFTYNSTQDGSLNTHTTATGQTLTMGYDELRRLRTIPIISLAPAWIIPRRGFLRTPSVKITSTGGIEHRFRLDRAMGPPGLSSPTAQVEYGQDKTVRVS